MLQQLAHFIGIKHRVGFTGHDQAHAHQRLAELIQQCQRDWMAGHPQTDGAFFRMQQQPRDFAGGVQNKGIRPRQMSLENAEGAGVDLGEQAQLRQVATDQREIVLVVQPAQTAHTFHGDLVTDLATDCVGGVRGINHHPAATDDFDSLFDQARLRVFRMNLEKLTHILYLFRRRQ
ncbi:hypothetical protein D3C71_1306290 [compost metagenome]